MRSEEAPGQEKFLPATRHWTLDTGHWTLTGGHLCWSTLSTVLEQSEGEGRRRNTAVNNEVNTEMGDDILSGAGHEAQAA